MGVRPLSFISLAKQPLTHFLLLGAALFLLYSAVGRESASDEKGTIHVDSAELQSLAAQWRARTGRWPTADDVAYLVEARVRREILFREALALDLHLNDAGTRRRLAAQLEAQWRDTARAVPPSERQLRAHFESNPTLYRDPMHLTFSQRFFARNRAGAGARAEALAALDRLSSGGSVTGHEQNDATTLTLRSVERIADRFGPGFTAQVMKQADEGLHGRWFGPIESSAGWYVVRIESYSPAGALSFEEARSRVESDWRKKFVTGEIEDRMKALRSRYAVRVAKFDQVIAKVAD